MDSTEATLPVWGSQPRVLQLPLAPLLSSLSTSFLHHLSVLGIFEFLVFLIDVAVVTSFGIPITIITAALVVKPFPIYWSESGSPTIHFFSHSPPLEVCPILTLGLPTHSMHRSLCSLFLPLDDDSVIQ